MSDGRTLTPPARRRKTLAERRQPAPGFTGWSRAESDTSPLRPTAWWRRPRWLIAAGVAATLAVAVITDLPGRTTPASQLASAQGTVRTIASDAASCTFSLGEAQRLTVQDLTTRITSGQRGVLEGLINGDYDACSLTNNDIYNLVNIETSSSPVGRQLAVLRDGIYEWANPYAFGVIGDLATIVSSGLTPARARQLARDATSANRQLASLEAASRKLHEMVGGPVPSLGLVKALETLPKTS